MKLAIVDYDGTLFKKETIPFLLELAKVSEIKRIDYYTTLIKIFSLLFIYKSKLNKNFDKERFHIDVAKIFLGIFKNMSPSNIDNFFKGASTEAENHFNTKMISELNRLKNEGFYLILLSGGFKPYLEKIGEKLFFDKVIATEINYGEKGFDVNKEIKFITGKNKKEVILEMFSNKDIDWGNSCAYADSYFDSDVLELTGNPHAVNPDDRLKKYAEQKGWTIFEKEG